MKHFLKTHCKADFLCWFHTQHTLLSMYSSYSILCQPCSSEFSSERQTTEVQRSQDKLLRRSCSKRHGCLSRKSEQEGECGDEKSFNALSSECRRFHMVTPELLEGGQRAWVSACILLQTTVRTGEEREERRLRDKDRNNLSLLGDLCRAATWCRAIRSIRYLEAAQ